MDIQNHSSINHKEKRDMSGITSGRLSTLMGIVLTVFLLSGIYGCGKKASDNAEGNTSSNEAAASSGEKKDGGTEAASSSGGGESSSTMPGDIPAYPGSKKDQEAKMGNQTVVSYTSSDAIKAIHDFYAKEVPGAGWTVTADVNADAGASITGTKDGWTLAIAIAKNPMGEGSLISMTYGK